MYRCHARDVFTHVKFFAVRSLAQNVCLCVAGAHISELYVVVMQLGRERARGNSLGLTLVLRLTLAIHTRFSYSNSNKSSSREKYYF